MDKEVLIQHCEMKAEIKDIRRRKEKLEKEIGRLGIVSDTVKGTRLDGTYGSIKITGYPRSLRRTVVGSGIRGFLKNFKNVGSCWDES